MQTQAERRAFLERRQKGIGGSDLGPIIGVHPFGKTAIDVWREKVLPLRDEPLTGPQKRGIALEPIIGAEYAADHDTTLMPGETHSRPDLPFVLSSPDFIIPQRRIAGVEIKCPGIEQFAKLKYDGISQQYICQAMQGFLVFGFAFVDFRFHNAERWEYIDVRVEPNESLMRDLLTVQEQFWHDHVLTEIPPAADTFHVQLPTIEGRVQLITEEDTERIAAVRTLRDVKAARREIEGLHDLSVETIKTLLGATGTYEAPGDEPGKVHRIQFVQSEGRKGFDLEGLKAHGALDPERVQAILLKSMESEKIERNVALELIEQLKHGARFNFDVAFQKRGASFTTLRLYPNAKAR